MVSRRNSVEPSCCMMDAISSGRNRRGCSLKPIELPMQCKVCYNLGQPPTRSTQLQRGLLMIDSMGLRIEGAEPAYARFDDIADLSFAREFGLFHIIVRAPTPIFITPVLVSLLGLVNIMLESWNSRVYTALHQKLGGPGRCAKCKYDMRESMLPCPEWGGEIVSPIF